MASWAMHTMIADKLLCKNLSLNKKGFCIGNIAPDCNFENENWTVFTPPREVTHFMKDKNKLTTDFEGFYNQYIKDESFDSEEHRSFLLGYYSHLVTDVEFYKFVRNEERVKNSFERIKSNDVMRKMIEGYPENFDTLKKVFGRNTVLEDIEILDNYYLISNPQAVYNSILRKTEEFKDYLSFFPKGAIARKIKILTYEPRQIEKINNIDFYFFSQEEQKAFVEKTSDIIYEYIANNI